MSIPTHKHTLTIYNSSDTLSIVIVVAPVFVYKRFVLNRKCTFCMLLTNVQAAGFILLQTKAIISE